MQSLTFNMFTVPEKIPDILPTKSMIIFSLEIEYTHQIGTNHIVHDLFNVCRNHTMSELQ